MKRIKVEIIMDGISEGGNQTYKKGEKGYVDGYGSITNDGGRTFLTYAMVDTAGLIKSVPIIYLRVVE